MYNEQRMANIKIWLHCLHIWLIVAPLTIDARLMQCNAVAISLLLLYKIMNEYHMNTPPMLAVFQLILIMAPVFRNWWVNWTVSVLVSGMLIENLARPATRDMRMMRLEFALFIVRTVHRVLKWFMIVVPFIPCRESLTVGCIALPLTIAHWLTNNNRCALTLIEHRLERALGWPMSVGIANQLVKNNDLLYVIMTLLTVINWFHLSTVTSYDSVAVG